MQLPTPLERAPDVLSAGRALFLKREDLHELGAFKWRGALPAVFAYGKRGAAVVVTASTGNHGAAAAWAAARAGMRAIVYVPEGASRTKLEFLAAQGAEAREEGADLDEAKERGKAFAGGSGFAFFEDGADPEQLGGYAAIGEEIVSQSEEPAGTVVVPLGNGALLAGVGQAIRSQSPSTAVVGVASSASPVMGLAFRAGRAVPCGIQGTFADGLAVRVAIPSAVDRILRVADEVRLVSEREIAQAVGAYASAGIRAEGAAAAALALYAKSADLAQPVVLLVTGRNIDEALHRRAVEDPGSFAG
ncbi:MAG: pyridoxal-phosphate dependent enzyme [Acidobacteriota bacterium]